MRIERHYGAPQDTEWAFDADGDGLDAAVAPGHVGGRHAGRPRPAARRASRSSAAWAPRPAARAARCGASPRCPTPRALGAGDVLVTHMTAPDWVPLMRRAAAIVTDSGGMTCHAAIVSRELGIPCVVGTGDATTRLRDGEVVTVDATHGGVLEGAASGRAVRPRPPAAARRGPPRRGRDRDAAAGQPVRALAGRAGGRAAVDGVGLLRAELMVLEALEGVHPRLLIEQGRGEEFVSADGRRADDLRRRRSRRGRSRTARSTSARTSSAGWRAATASSPRRPTR